MAKLYSNLKTGWIPDHPDIRDLIYEEWHKLAAKWHWPVLRWLSVARGGVLPDKVDLRESGMLPAVFDQGACSSCTANAWCAAFEFLELEEKAKSQTPLSRLFLYYNERDDKAVDSGATIRAGVKSVASAGICREDLWKYDITKWAEKPAQEAYANALPRKDIKYYRILTLDGMLHCLAGGNPFVFGVSIYSQFQDAGPDGMIRMPNDKMDFLGGHALCCVGYDKKKEVFIVRNSWGQGWGDRGYCYIPFDYLCSPALCDDRWTCYAIPLAD